jgi:anti-anti-sigma factor
VDGFPRYDYRAMKAENTYAEITNSTEALRVEGLTELTAANCKLFRKQVCAALNGHTIVEIDLSQTMSLDCAGLGALIAVRNLARPRNCIVRLVNPTSPVQQLLDLVRAGRIFEIVHTRPADHRGVQPATGRVSQEFGMGETPQGHPHNVTARLPRLFSCE